MVRRIVVGCVAAASMPVRRMPMVMTRGRRWGWLLLLFMFFLPLSSIRRGRGIVLPAVMVVVRMRIRCVRPRSPLFIVGWWWFPRRIPFFLSLGLLLLLLFRVRRWFRCFQAASHELSRSFLTQGLPHLTFYNVPFFNLYPATGTLAVPHEPTILLCHGSHDLVSDLFLCGIIGRMMVGFKILQNVTSKGLVSFVMEASFGTTTDTTTRHDILRAQTVVATGPFRRLITGTHYFGMHTHTISSPVVLFFFLRRRVDGS
mmetsp:Transcript_7761/g.16055  ORF Transcript_7761/g.16055 Transcript_7761/m.16055 type:complete len:258 (+) Transcript_7761:967-1740(+)